MLLRRVGAVEQRLLHTDIKGGWLSLLKADSWQRGDELQCHMQKTRIKALSCMAYTYPFPPELSSRILGCEDTCVAGKPQLRAESRPQHQERQSRVRDPGWIALGIAERAPAAPTPPWVWLGQAHSSTRRSNPLQSVWSVFSTPAPKGLLTQALSLRQPESARWPRLRFHIWAHTRLWLVTGKLCQ